VRVNLVKLDKAWVIGIAAFPNPSAKTRVEVGSGFEVKYCSTTAPGSTASNAADRIRATRGSRNV